MSILAVDDYGGRIQALRPGTARTLTLDTTPRTTPPLSTGISVVRLVSTVPCLLAFGVDPEATVAAGHRLPAEVPEYFRVAPGDRLAAVRASTDGTLHISEMT